MLDTDDMDTLLENATPIELTLKSLTASAAHVINDLAAHRPDFEIEAAGAKRKFAWAADFTDEETSQVCIELALGARRLDVFCSTNVLQRFCQDAGFEHPSQAAIAAAGPIMMELFLGDALSALEDELDMPVSVANVTVCQTTVTPHTHAAFRQADTETGVTLYASLESLSDFGLELLLAFFAQPFGTCLDRLFCTAALHSYPVQFSSAEYASYRVGDVMVMSDGWITHSERLFVVNQALMASVSAAKSKWQLDGPFRSSRVALSHYYSEAQLMNQPDGTKISDIPVMVTAEFDRAELSIAELDRLNVGSIVPFQNRQPEKVKLFANGKYFADGHLVEVDGRVGIRLDSLSA